MPNRPAKSRKLWKLSVRITAPAAEEAIINILRHVSGLPPVSYTDAQTGRVVLSVFFPNTKPSADLQDRLTAALQALRRLGHDIGLPRVKIESIQPEDWAESWKRHFKPLAIGSTLLIKPSWSKRKPSKSQALVVLDPGLSFGTGQHPTTGFCLEQLVCFRQPHSKQSLLDIGTGSGILAIAADKLGYTPVDAFDLDPTAVAIARRNARRNRARRTCRIFAADLAALGSRGHRQYDLVCANLVFDLLVNQRKRILNRVKPGGALVLAGILKKEFSRLKQVYLEEGFKLISSRAEGEWRSGTFRSFLKSS
jgi:ribosomal protein L11 methyltransferase